MRLVVGTRGSKLALWQARHVSERLRSRHPDLEVDQLIIRTGGDRDHDRSIAESGGRGVFVLEIEEALLDGRIDVAVHSMKDLPTELPGGLTIAAVPGRHDPRDVLLSRDGHTLEELPRGATVATGSLRRRCQLLHARPELEIVPVRGNVDTRVRKLEQGQFDALVLALAGIERLGITSVPAVPLAVEICLPAVGQGALAIETRAADTATIDRVRALEDHGAARAVAAERAFLRRLGGGCLAPATAHARPEGDGLRLDAVVGDLEGQRLLRQRATGSTADAPAIGVALAERMLDAGAGELLRDSRDAAGHGPP